MNPEHPYRAAGITRAPRPIEFESRVLAYDLTNGPVAPFVTATNPDIVMEPVLGGSRMRSVSTPNWMRSVFLGDYDLPNCGVRTAFRLDGEPNAMVRIWFRHFKVGNVALGYVLTLRPLVRQYRLTRYAGTEVDPLVDWSTSQHIVPGMGRNVVELSARGDQILVVCNDQMLTLLHDASFARGSISIGGSAPSPRDAIIFEFAELWTVA